VSGHRHVWCQLRSGAATCRCGLMVTDRLVLASVDPAAYQQLIDPDGLQRAFLETCGLQPHMPEDMQLFLDAYEQVIERSSPPCL